MRGGLRFCSEGILVARSPPATQVCVLQEDGSGEAGEPKRSDQGGKELQSGKLGGMTGQSREGNA